MEQSKDSLLVQQCLEGSETAFEELLNLYKNQIFSFTLRMVGNAEDAEDLAQEAFIKAFRALGSYDAKYPFITWLFRIARNTTIDFIRARKPQAVSIDDEDAPIEIENKADSPETAAAFTLEAEMAERLLMSLPELYREVVMLQYKENLTCAEIASITGMPEGTVKIRLFRAKALLKTKISETGFLK